MEKPAKVIFKWSKENRKQKRWKCLDRVLFLWLIWLYNVHCSLWPCLSPIWAINHLMCLTWVRVGLLQFSTQTITISWSSQNITTVGTTTTTKLTDWMFGGFCFLVGFFFSPESRTMNLIQSRSLWNQHDIVQFGFQHLVVIIQIAKFKNQFIFPFFPQVRDPTAADEEQNRFFHDCVWIIKIQMFIVADIFRSYARKFCDSEALYLISLSAYMGKPASVDFSVCC